MGVGQGLSWLRVILGGGLAFGIATVLVALVGPLVAVRIAGGDSYQITDEAMAPTLLAGDWVLGEALPKGVVPPRGAIVAYDRPAGHGDIGVLRVLGLPGEQVQMRGGALYIDGQRARMERLADRVIRNLPSARHAPMPICINRPVPIDGECRQEQWREILPDGTATLVLNGRGDMGLFVPGGHSPDDTPPMRVPEGSVFLLGDNRDVAVDSRFEDFGMVPLGELRHRIWLIHSSLDKASRFFHPRWNRFFRRVM